MNLIKNVNIVHQATPERLIDDTLRLEEGLLSSTGALVIKTGCFTGRSPKDKYIVKDEVTESTVNWNDVNNSVDEKCFDVAFDRVLNYLNNTVPELWVQDCYACADERYRLNIRVTSDKPWIALFAHNIFLRPCKTELKNFVPAWRVFVAPSFLLDPSECGTRNSNATIISFKHKIILVAGTGYTGEIKKSIFAVLNYILPRQNVLSMHCSANVGANGDTAIFFGLSGTGKTTLSADPQRRLIGDDEHGWTADNIFNFEGGCYAKCINLSKEKEPGIYNAICYGALVENTQFFPESNIINLGDASITENTRVSYPLHFIADAIQPSMGNIPKNIFFLTCDAYGVLPPISRLTAGQAMYQFISGYTAKVAGTETGITEPKPTFSACFGAPFLPLHPKVYAAMLGRKIKENDVKVWLVNTGWTGGPYGIGRRIKLSYTRAMISAALRGDLKNFALLKDRVFGFDIPVECPGVPFEILLPRNTWADKYAYDQKANFLGGLFIKNFEKYASQVNKEVLEAAPKARSDNFSH